MDLEVVTFRAATGCFSYVLCVRNLAETTPGSALSNNENTKIIYKFCRQSSRHNKSLMNIEIYDGNS